MIRGAIFSECGRYRFRLWRIWDTQKPAICFVLLNPSTADEVKNDPTVERCQRRAQLWGYGRLDVVNIFAWRSTNPDVLTTVDNPEGSPYNDMHIRDAVSLAQTVICAWGAHGLLNKRHQCVLRLLEECKVEGCALRVNGDGTPAHPLYVPYSAQPFKIF